MTQAVSEDDTFLDEEHVLEEDWLAAPRRRSRLRLLLAGLLAASVCFLGGVLVQKQFGAATDSAVSGGLPSGFPGGGQPGAGAPSGFPGGGLPDGQTTGDGQGTSGSSGESATSGADSKDAVVGTVVTINGNTWVVEDLGGHQHEVHVTDDADIVRETKLTAGQVAVGDQVDISGTTQGNQLQADQVTLR